MSEAQAQAQNQTQNQEPSMAQEKVYSWAAPRAELLEEVFIDEIVDKLVRHRKGVLKIEKGELLEITYNPNAKLTCKKCDEGTLAHFLYEQEEDSTAGWRYKYILVELWIDQVTGIYHADDDELREQLRDGLNKMLQVIMDNESWEYYEDGIDIAYRMSEALQDFFFTETKGMELSLYQCAGPDCPNTKLEMIFTG